ncbi:DEAD/DEAH box helicase [Chloroflexales bacterium ZM16-3]|nr:DEAD/DEAH box helicase [Chloroflexales bacterium ZM16-3]
MPQPGALVRYRHRDWVVLPSEDPNVIMLRPIGGGASEVCGVVLPLADRIAASLPHERMSATAFPLPAPDDVQDIDAVRLLLDAARLLLRDGAAPFRALGRLSFRPRPYQFVPLLMALRQETVRLLIADDVGVGKTIEGALIARELLDRGLIQRIVVLCPPALCDQWQRELAEKVNIDATVIRSGTISRLEKQTPQNRSIFRHHRHLVASIDLVKNDTYRAAFLEHLPDLVLVDEVHGAARPAHDRGGAQQQRYELLRAIAQRPGQHLVLLSATPHSGVEESFRSILGLLKPTFAGLNLSQLSEGERIELATYFVQRRRADVRHWMGADTPFPERVSIEAPYRFSPSYDTFYREVYAFARGVVETAETMGGWKQRMRYWSALALLRCVSSSPSAALAALQSRGGTVPVDDAESGDEPANPPTTDELDAAVAPLVADPMEQEQALDSAPPAMLTLADRAPDWQQAEQRKLDALASMAKNLVTHADEDAKLLRIVAIVRDMLRAGFRPIVWCRYLATAAYVKAEIEKRLGRDIPHLRVESITGDDLDDVRRTRLTALAEAKQRVLVATDCLSEGVNLQAHFNAVIHYDLPWNPNRLEQREGRVDRFGQLAPQVQAVLIYGEDNPVDGAVLDVLLRKAREIQSALGVRVSVPVDSDTVMQTVLRSLFAPGRSSGMQLSLFDVGGDADTQVDALHARWRRGAEEEKESRTRFAQRSIKPEEVERELRAADTILGSADEVRDFLLAACGRLNVALQPAGEAGWNLHVGMLPPVVRQRLGARPDIWPISVISPTPAGLDYIGRNHPLIEALAEYLIDLAFHPTVGDHPAARGGVIRTTQISQRTTLLLLRPRYLVDEPGSERPGLAEETLVWGFTGTPPAITPIAPDDARALLATISAAANIAPEQQRAALQLAVEQWNALCAPEPAPSLRALLDTRGTELQESHSRIRRLLRHSRARIVPQLPPDLLGVVVLLPLPKI